MMVYHVDVNFCGLGKACEIYSLKLYSYCKHNLVLHEVLDAHDGCSRR